MDVNTAVISKSRCVKSTQCVKAIYMCSTLHTRTDPCQQLLLRADAKLGPIIFKPHLKHLNSEKSSNVFSLQFPQNTALVEAFPQFIFGSKSLMCLVVEV